MSRAHRWLGLIALVMLQAGCGPSDVQYWLVLQNSGSNEVDEAHVAYGDFVSVGGWLGPGINAGHLVEGRPVPETATVQWRTSDGVLHQQEVEVKRLVPAKFRGHIYFVIDSSNRVTVVAEPDPYR